MAAVGVVVRRVATRLENDWKAGKPGIVTI